MSLRVYRCVVFLSPRSHINVRGCVSTQEQAFFVLDEQAFSPML